MSHDKKLREVKNNTQSLFEFRKYLRTVLLLEWTSAQGLEFKLLLSYLVCAKKFNNSY